MEAREWKEWNGMSGMIAEHNGMEVKEGSGVEAEWNGVDERINGMDGMEWI